LAYRFVWQLGAEFLQALELFHGTAVLTLGVRLVAQHQGQRVGFPGQFADALGQEETAVLFFGDFDIFLEFRFHADPGIDEGLAEGAGEEGGFELGGAPHGRLGAGHAVDGFELLGVYGTVAVDEAGAKLFELGGIPGARRCSGRERGRVSRRFGMSGLCLPEKLDRYFWRRWRD